MDPVQNHAALFCILRLSRRCLKFLVVVFDSGNLRNVCSCELRTKKHMFKAEEHFHHAPISSSSGSHGLTGAGVGVAVKPVEPSSVKLYDAFHQGSPVFFYSFLMLTYCELHGHIFLFETSSNWST